jgi:hypothetical protein
VALVVRDPNKTLEVLGAIALSQGNFVFSREIAVLKVQPLEPSF